MKYTISKTIFLIFCVSQLNAQTKKEIENGIFVTFPVDPSYTTTITVSNFAAKTESCLFMVLIQRNVIPNYAEYVKARQKWTDAEIDKVENSLLDNTVKGKLYYTGNKGTVSIVKIGKYNGRKIEYSAINPATGERGKRYAKVFFVRNMVISFDVWFLKDNQTAIREKDKFLNSIKTQ